MMRLSISGLVWALTNCCLKLSAADRLSFESPFTEICEDAANLQATDASRGLEVMPDSGHSLTRPGTALDAAETPPHATQHSGSGAHQSSKSSVDAALRAIQGELRRCFTALVRGVMLTAPVALAEERATDGTYIGLLLFVSALFIAVSLVLAFMMLRPSQFAGRCGSPEGKLVCSDMSPSSNLGSDVSSALPGWHPHSEESLSPVSHRTPREVEPGVPDVPMQFTEALTDRSLSSHASSFAQAGWSTQTLTTARTLMMRGGEPIVKAAQQMQQTIYGLSPAGNEEVLGHLRFTEFAGLNNLNIEVQRNPRLADFHVSVLLSKGERPVAMLDTSQARAPPSAQLVRICLLDDQVSSTGVSTVRRGGQHQGHYIVESETPVGEIVMNINVLMPASNLSELQTGTVTDMKGRLLAKCERVRRVGRDEGKYLLVLHSKAADQRLVLLAWVAVLKLGGPHESN